MINLATITASLLSSLQADATLASLGFRTAGIVRGDYVNKDPSLAPWLGLYRTMVDYSPRCLGTKNPGSWEGKITIRMLVQASTTQGGDACEDLLESYVKAALDAVWADPTWSNVVDMVTALNVEYSYKEDDTSTIYFQWAMVTITAEVSTG